MRISLIASSVRCWLWYEMMDSLKSNTIEYEVILAGNLNEFQVRPFLTKYPQLKYVFTEDIPPAQCYEIARRNATGDLIMWIADDCEFSDRFLDNIIGYLDVCHISITRKLLLSVKTNENNTNNDLDDHRFFGGNKNTPLMAPLGVMNREYLNELGGFDRRFLCGQYENDVAMRVLSDGGEVIKYEEGCVNIEHLKKHGEGTKFWTGYNHDRKVLEDIWVLGGYKPVPEPFLTFIKGDWLNYFPLDNREVSRKPLLPFEPYKEEGLLTINQSSGEWK